MNKLFLTELFRLNFKLEDKIKVYEKEMNNPTPAPCKKCGHEHSPEIWKKRNITENFKDEVDGLINIYLNEHSK